MSVIIKLQNLPWIANASDIRTYFKGLSIPEGGVHIIGGEQGDAFIAFSTDEDARQAMLLDGGKLKEVKIKLLLSSRTEMVKVIEQAKQHTLGQSVYQGVVAPPVVPQSIPMNTIPLQTNIEEHNKVKEDHKIKDDENNLRDRRELHRSVSRERGRSRGRDSKDRSRTSASRDRDRSRGKYRDRDRRRRDRSRSRDRYRRRSRSRDRRRSSKSKDKESKDHSRNRRKETKETEDNTRNGTNETVEDPTWDASQNTAKVPLLPDPPAVPPILMQIQQAPKEMVAPPAPVIIPPQDMRTVIQYPQMGPMQMGPPLRGRDNWNTPQLPGLMDAMPMGMPQRPMLTPMEMGIAGYPPGFGMPMMPNPNDPNNLWRPPMPQAATFDVKPEESDVCIEIRGLPLNVSYIDVKKLFDGLSIPPDGIKMINDNHGNRTGIAYVRFSVPNHKKAALNQNGKKVRSNVVEVIHLRDSIYQTAIDNYKPEKDVSKNVVNMDLEKDDSPDEDSWSRERARDRNRDRDRDRGDRDANKPRSRFKISDPRINKGNNIEQHSEKRTDTIILQGIPPNANENDIVDFFDEFGIIPVNIHIVLDNKRQPTGEAFCQFKSFEETIKAFAKHNSYMGPYMLSIHPARREEMERAIQLSQENPMWPPFQRGGGGPPILSLNSRVPSMQGPPYSDRPVETERFTRFSDRDTRFISDRGNGEERPMRYRENGRDNPPPRERGGPPMRGRNMRGGPPGPNDSYPAGPHSRGGPLRRSAREQSPYIDDSSVEHFGKPGCVVSLENLHFRAEIDEIIHFFESFIVKHENVIRRFDESGRATGDARVALNSPNEAMRAVKLLNFKMLRGRPVKVSLLQ